MRAAIVACSVAGTLISAHVSRADVLAAFAFEHAAFGELMHHLLGEERVTSGVPGDEIAYRDSRWIGTQ